MYSWVTYVALLFPAITVAGLIVAAIGAFVTARAVILTDKEAIQVGGRTPMPIGYLGRDRKIPHPTTEQFMQQFSVQNLIRQSRYARRGLVLIGVGTILQLVGTIPSFFGH